MRVIFLCDNCRYMYMESYTLYCIRMIVCIRYSGIYKLGRKFFDLLPLLLSKEILYIFLSWPIKKEGGGGRLSAGLREV